MERYRNFFDLGKFMYDLNDHVLNSNHAISSDSHVNKNFGSFHENAKQTYALSTNIPA